MKHLYVLFFALLFATNISAQEETIFNGSGIRLTGVFGGGFNSIVDFQDDFNISSGGFFTFEINNDFLIGWQGYRTGIDDDGRDIDIDGNDLLLGYTLNSDKVIHPIFYVQFGSSDLEVEGIGSDNVFVVQPSIGAELNIARWFRIGIDGGYRFFNNSDIPGFSDADFSSPVVGLRLKFGWSWGRSNHKRNRDHDYDFDINF